MMLPLEWTLSDEEKCRAGMHFVDRCGVKGQDWKEHSWGVVCSVTGEMLWPYGEIKIPDEEKLSD